MIAPAKPKPLEPRGGFSFDSGLAATQHRHTRPRDTCLTGRSPPGRWLVSRTRCQRAQDRRRGTMWPMPPWVGRFESAPSGRFANGSVRSAGADTSRQLLARRETPVALPPGRGGHPFTILRGTVGTVQSLSRSACSKASGSQLTTSRPSRAAWFDAVSRLCDSQKHLSSAGFRNSSHGRCSPQLLLVFCTISGAARVSRACRGAAAELSSEARFDEGPLGRPSSRSGRQCRDVHRGERWSLDRRTDPASFVCPCRMSARLEGR